MKLGADQTGELLAAVAATGVSDCLTVAEVFIGKTYHISMPGPSMEESDVLAARVVGCKGYDRIWYMGDKPVWKRMPLAHGDKQLPPAEREEYTDEDWKHYCLCDAPIPARVTRDVTRGQRREVTLSNGVTIGGSRRALSILLKGK